MEDDPRRREFVGGWTSHAPDENNECLTEWIGLEDHGANFPEVGILGIKKFKGQGFTFCSRILVRR